MSPDGAPDLTIGRDEAMVAVVEIDRAPNNYLDIELLGRLAGEIEALDADPSCRAIVLCSTGKHFCAGVDLAGPDKTTSSPGMNRVISDIAARLLDVCTPIVAAVHGKAIGGGLGLAMIADLRVADPAASFAAPFVKLGIHHGFGLSVTLVDAIGRQRALDLLVTGRRVDAAEALAIGLCDRVADAGRVRDAALALAGEIAANAPLAVASIRHTVRDDVVDRFRAATERERNVQDELRLTADCAEALRAAVDRRAPVFQGR